MGVGDVISNFISTNIPWMEISKGPVLSYKPFNKWHIYNKSKHVPSMVDKAFFQVNPYINMYCVINYVFLQV